MIEPLSPPATCRVCGAPVNESWPASGGLCPRCATLPQGEFPPASTQVYPPPANAQQVYPPPPANAQQVYPPPAYPYPSYQDYQVAQLPQVIDPDYPHWGIWTGIGAWLFSVAALFGAGVVVLGVMFSIDHPQPDAIQEWGMSPHVVVASVYSTIPAHLLTLLFCWAVVTRLGKQPFFASLGWNWAGHSPFYWLGLALLMFVGIILLNRFVFGPILPERKTPFDDLLKTGGPQVRLAVAILASTSAPVVEELVYRGVLYGGLRKRFSVMTTIIVVTLLFTSVHVLQYWGAWASIAGLMVLSLALTVVRTKSKSLLPCIVLHFVNNAVISLLLVLYKGDV